MLNRKRHILLIVDDDNINRLLLRSALEHIKSLLILEVSNGVDAVVLSRAGLKFDIVLMDVMMPEMDGITASKHIKENDPNSIIIRVSAYGREMPDISPFDEVVNKPVSAKELVKKVKSYLK